MLSAIATTLLTTIVDLVDCNANVAHLLEDDNIVTLENDVTDEYDLSASIKDNFKELESARPEWQPDTQAVHPKWLEHHESGHLTKDKNCPICVEGAGSKVAHWRKKGDRQPGGHACRPRGHSNPLQMATSTVWLQP